MQRLAGVPASEGIAVGVAFVYHPATIVAQRRAVADMEADWACFLDAVATGREQLGDLHRRTVAAAGEEAAGIFQAQQLMLEDPELLSAVEERVQGGLNAETAWALEIERFAAQLDSLQVPYLRERAADLRDVGQRVLRILAGAEEKTLSDPQSPSIVVAPDLTPSETAQMNREMVLGLATARGGATSHTAILARNLGLPAVVGLGKDLLGTIRSGASLIIDGYEGLVIVDPDQDTLDEYLERQARTQTGRETARLAARAPAVTRDGYRVKVLANIGDVASADEALAYGAEGVGLLRTEFLFLESDMMPDEEEQYTAYRAIAVAMGERPLVIRTLDVGGDKPPSFLSLGEEENPALGFRAIRVSLAHPEMLQTQLRAILRAGAGCNVKVIFPMIATVEEVRTSLQMLKEARADLRRRGVTFMEEIEAGAMIETPAAAVCAPLLARKVDFFSLGTNDLIQYTLAADRTNERVGYLYDPLHPAILRLVANVISAAHDAGKWVGMCGEMAAEPDAVPLLLGMGLDEFSVNPAQIPQVKALLRALDRDATQDLVARALDLSTATEIRELVRASRGG